MRALIEDTKQKLGQHTLKNDGWAAGGVQVVRCALPWGDYVLAAPVSVDTKRDIYELAMDIDQDHARFRAECKGAREAGCQLVVLVENEDGVETLDDLARWVEAPAHYAMRKRKSGNPRARIITGKRLAGACKTMAERYGVMFEFCHPDDAARRVLEILGGGDAVGDD